MALLLMAGVREKLNVFLDRAAARPFEWGVSDCVLDVADWLDYACGKDIAAEWRGRYHDEAGAYALMPGGLEAKMRSEMARHSIEVCAWPRFGDVGLVRVPGQAEKPLAAILMLSGRWRMRTLTGIALTKAATVIVAWSLPCRP